ncbi:MAG: glycyl radical protein [Clostridia bacterium]|nr:glycyl radical protein [Clostridia bacterium]
MAQYYNKEIPKSPRIDLLKKSLFANKPRIEADRAVLLTESYKATEELPIIERRAKAFSHILHNLPVTIRENELVVGSNTVMPRSCQTFPEYSFQWLEDEFETISERAADPFEISEETKQKLRDAYKYWGGKTTSELASSYMCDEAALAIEHNIFTVGNYYYNGVGHVTVDYGKVLKMGYNGIKAEAQKALSDLCVCDAEYSSKAAFQRAVIECCDAVIFFANRYADMAEKMAAECNIEERKSELFTIARNCRNVPANGAKSFYEACQSFWFVQLLIQTEGSGHSISPGRFDQYMYPYYKADLDAGIITREFAQELVDCVWIKLNDLSKVRDAASAAGFAGYSMFQNLICGGQTPDGRDATNDLSFMCITASLHTNLPQPSLSMRVWNGTPHDLLVWAAKLTRTGIGLPAYYNDEVIIPALVSRGLTMQDARDYNIIGCVEPQKSGKTDGWHDAAFFNMCSTIELVFTNGYENGKLISIETGDIANMNSFEEFFDAYKKQMKYFIALMVNADNAVDMAHAQRAPLPFLSSMLDDCIKKGKSAQEGGCVYNFTGPQGFGIANVADSLYTIKKLVFEQKKFTLTQLKSALDANFGKGTSTASDADLTNITVGIVKTLAESGAELSEAQIAEIYKSVSAASGKKSDSQYEDILRQIDELDKFGNDIDEVDALAREAAYSYTRPLEKYTNPRGGKYHAGLYPVSANVPLGAQTGATPDGRLAYTPVADGVSPTAGKDVSGPTASANSVSKLDHGIASNGTLFNMKFHPSALEGDSGIESFIALIRGYFDRKGMHVQFNVVSRETLLDAQKHPENYQGLVVRVAGYSAMFTTLSKSLQDDIINRTQQCGF